MGQVISKFAQLNRLPDRAKFVPGSSSDVLRNVTLTEGGVNYVRPLNFWDGYLYGVGIGSFTGIYRSADSGASWTQINSSVGGSTTLNLYKTADGEILLMTSASILKSSGWSSNMSTATFSTVHTANSPATFTSFSVDFDHGTKLIATQYGPGLAGGAEWAASRYAHISLDAGDTWTLVWDSATDAGVAGDTSSSHMHGAAYDQWNDRFYLSEGHGTQRGIYYSDDDGTTWTRIAGSDPANVSFFDAAPTVLIATENGLVVGTDGGQNGVYVFPYVSDMSASYPEFLAPWKPDYAAIGTYGFAIGKFRDPVSGLVFISFQSSVALSVPVFSSDGLSAKEIYALATDESTDAGQRIHNPILTDGNKFIADAWVGSGGTRNVLKADLLPVRLNQSVDAKDLSFVLGNPVSPDYIGSQFAVGPGCDLSGAAGNCLAIGSNVTIASSYEYAIGICARGPAIGNGSIAIATNSPSGSVGTQAICIGNEITSPGTRGVTIGYRAIGTQESVVIGYDAESASGLFDVIIGGQSYGTGSSCVVIGHAAKGSAAYDCIVGFSADGTGTGQRKTAIGTSALATGTGAVAIGGSAQAVHADGVALGYQVETTAVNQVCIEDRHIEFNEMTEPAAPAANGARLYVKDDGAGKTQLCVRFATGAVQVIATEP